ncbi:MAG: HD domain-containing protein [Candidatus Aenigmatarchaeota archaeon]
MDKLRLEKIIGFLEEIEKFKTVERRVMCSDLKRCESDAEHSWHLAMFILAFEKDLPEGLDILKMIKLALVHDLVEIYAGDPFAFDKAAREGKKEREADAAKKLSALLPADLSDELRLLIDEYESAKTKESGIVHAFDKISPILQNLCSDGWSWKENGIVYEDIEDYKRQHVECDKTALELYEALMGEAKTKNLFADRRKE